MNRNSGGRRPLSLSPPSRRRGSRWRPRPGPGRARPTWSCPTSPRPNSWAACSTATRLLLVGLLICAAGLIFGLVFYRQLKKLPVHRSMLEVSELIYATCKTYLFNQGKFILLLWLFIAAVIVAYFGFLVAGGPPKAGGGRLPDRNSRGRRRSGSSCCSA